METFDLLKDSMTYSQLVSGDNTGQGLCDRVVPILRQLKLEFDWIIGQRYDGASNMSAR